MIQVRYLAPPSDSVLFYAQTLTGFFSQIRLLLSLSRTVDGFQLLAC